MGMGVREEETEEEIDEGRGCKSWGRDNGVF